MGFLPFSHGCATIENILINTCSVREKPEQKVRSLLGRYKKLKQANDELVIGVTGCYAQQAKGDLLRRFDDLDLVMGPDARRAVLIASSSLGVFLPEICDHDLMFAATGVSLDGSHVPERPPPDL